VQTPQHQDYNEVDARHEGIPGNEQADEEAKQWKRELSEQCRLPTVCRGALLTRGRQLTSATGNGSVPR